VAEQAAPASTAAIARSHAGVTAASAIGLLDANRAWPAFHLEDQLRRDLAAGGDVPLYTAARDILPPALDEHGRKWRLDAVRYAGVDLPTSELGRSIGHWNPGDQIEAFHVISGSVQMVLCEPGDGPALRVRCDEGSIVILSPGWWHSTFVDRGPALVVNVYNAEGGPGDSTKYTRRRPRELSVLRAPHGTAVVRAGRPAHVLERVAPPATRFGIDSLEGVMAPGNAAALTHLAELANAPLDERFECAPAPLPTR